MRLFDFLVSSVSNLVERPLAEEIAMKGHIFDVAKMRVSLPDGSEGARDIVRTGGGAVAVVAIDDSARVCLVRQYRAPLRRVTTELPAGRLKSGEDPAACARRELFEETGAIAGRLEHLSTIASSPGFTDEVVHLYLARELSFKEACPDEGEFVKSTFVDFTELVGAVVGGIIVDAKTVAGTLLALVYLEGMR